MFVYVGVSNKDIRNDKYLTTTFQYLHNCSENYTFIMQVTLVLKFYEEQTFLSFSQEKNIIHSYFIDVAFTWPSSN